MKVYRERILADARHPYEVYYTMTGRALFNNVSVRCLGWGATPNSARLNLLYNQNRRRFPVE